MYAALMEGPCYPQTGILVTVVVSNEDRWHSRDWGGTKELHQMHLLCQSLRLLGKTPDTCYIHQLLNSLGSIHPLTCFKAPQVIQVPLPSLSIARCSFMAEWTEAPVSSPIARVRQFLMSQRDYAGLEPTILWLGVRRANHSAITTQYSWDGAEGTDVLAS